MFNSVWCGMTPGPVFTSLMGKNNTRTSASIRVFIHVKKECLISNQEAQEKGKFLSFAVPSLLFISGVQRCKKRFKGLFIVESALSLSSGLQALHSNTLKQIIQIQHNSIETPTGRRQPVGYLQTWPRI